MTAGEWVAVAAASTIASVALGAFLTLPVWRDRPRSGPRFVPALLSLHAGAAVVAGAVATGAAIKSWQLVGDETASSALIEVSRIDGDDSLYGLIVLVLVAATFLVTALLALTARFSASAHPVDRSIACAVIGLEIGVAGVGLAYLAGGSRSPAVLLAVAHLPLLLVAMVLCWPTQPRATPDARGR